MDHIVVDVEIAKTIEEVGGWDATDKMGVAVAVVWEYTNARMRVYGPDDLEALRERILRADRVTGYNTFNFDFPVIWGIAKGRWLNGATEPLEPGVPTPRYLKDKLAPKSDDLLRRIWVAQGFDPDRFQKGMGGTKLDDVAGATLGARKIGNGADAPKWFQAGQVQRVCNYCADDVALERDLCDFVEWYGYVLLRRTTGYDKLEVPPWKP